MQPMVKLQIAIALWFVIGFHQSVGAEQIAHLWRIAVMGNIEAKNCALWVLKSLPFGTRSVGRAMENSRKK